MDFLTANAQKFLSFLPTDAGNAEAFVFAYPNDFLYCEHVGWFHYTKTHWEHSEAREVLIERIIDMLNLRREGAKVINDKALERASASNKSRIQACEFVLQTMLRVRYEELDVDPERINFANGVVHLPTRTLEQHTPAHRFTYCSPATYDPNIGTSEWEAFIEQSVDKGAANYVQTLTGYCASGETREEITPFIYGPPRSGKGTFTEAIMAVLPQPCTDEINFGTFAEKLAQDNNNFDLAPLAKARIIFASEGNPNQRLDQAKIKQISGGNKLQAAFKHKTPFTFTPRFKVILVSNWPVMARADDDAIWSRLRVIKFPHSHVGTEDKALKAKMKSPAMQKQIAKWIVDGAYAYYTQGLHTPQCIVNETNDHQNEQDYIKAWIEAMMFVDANAFISNTEAYEAYCIWAEANGAPMLKLRGLTLALKQKNFRTNYTKKYGPLGLPVKGILGLSLPVRIPLRTGNASRKHVS